MATGNGALQSGNDALKVAYHVDKVSKHRINGHTLPFIQGCTSSGRYVARATKFCTLAPNICGSAWDSCHVTSDVCGILTKNKGI
jgi:hypothetical protein